jgi:thioredoxin reductase (NADPH)
VQRLPAGTVLFEPGARRVDFFLVLDGFIEAYASGGTAQQVVHVYGEQQFTGELNLFNDRAILVGGRMGGDGRVARLNCSQFRRLLAAEPDIANVVIRAIILRRERMFLHGHTGVTIIAPRRSAQSLQLQLFLTRNRHPYRMADPETESGAAAQLAELGLAVDDAPVVVCGDDRVLVCPTPRELGDHIGIAEPLDPQHVADVVVVGAGPAGLAAAVYSASEGLDTVVLEADAPGGQASTSSRIENYLGFPIGISGRELAQRAQVQAQKFGARIIVPRTVVRLVTDSPPYLLELDDGTHVRAHTVILATVRDTAASPWPISTDSKAVASTTPPPPSNPTSATATTRPWSAGATPPGRPRSSCHVSPTMCTSWCAATHWHPACPTTSSVASRRRPNASPCIHTPRSPP